VSGAARRWRILHVDTERGWRGGERQALWLAQALERMGHHSIIAARPGEPLSARALEAGLTVVPCAPAFEADPFAALRLRRVMRAQRIDVLHAHTAHAAALGAIATYGTQVPLVVARRVDFPLRDNFGTRLKYGRAAAVIAISHAVAAVLARSTLSPDRVVVVPDATDIHRTVVPASAEVLHSVGVAPGVPLVVQVSQLVGHKDPVNFVRAVDVARRQVPQLRALLVGEGSLRPDVEQTIASLGLEQTLTLTGYRRDADELLAAATVVCLSSKEEGMGSVLLDALLFGKPIVATRAGGIPEIVEHGVTGMLVSIRDADALGNAIARLIVDRPLAQRLADAARARAPEFSVERMAERTLAVYARVLGAG
jgi:L-malate glycosyltransferase